MKRFLVFIFILCGSVCALNAQKLSSMSRLQRDSMMLAELQAGLKKRYPERYREDVNPLTVKGDFRWIALGESACGVLKHRKMPGHVRPDDVYYEMTLYYWNWKNEGFTGGYTARGVFLDRTCEMLQMEAGPYNMLEADRLTLLTSGRKLAAMSRSGRDSLLVMAAGRAVREFVPRMYHDDVSVTVDKCTFNESDSAFIPFYADYGEVYYKLWFCRGGSPWLMSVSEQKPYMCVYVLENNGEPFMLADLCFKKCYTLVNHDKLTAVIGRVWNHDVARYMWLVKQKSAIEYNGRDMDENAHARYYYRYVRPFE